MTEQNDIPDPEKLSRNIKDDEINPDGTLKPKAFPIQDWTDPKRRGMSVNRQPEDEPSQAPQAFATHGQKVAETTAGQVRSVRSRDGDPALEVIKDPVDGNELHSLIKPKKKMEHSELREVRDDLKDEFRLVGQRGNADENDRQAALRPG